MEVKKTEQASLKGRNILYFLLGLDIALVIILGLFLWSKQGEMPEIEEPTEVVEVTEAVLIDIPEPETPPPPPPADEPPPPPPPEIPMEIEETPEPVEVPDIQEQKITPPSIPTGPKTTGPVTKVDLSALNTKAEPKKEERIDKPVTVNRVDQMAIYPGCEKFKGNKKKLIACFSEKLNSDIDRFLDKEYPDEGEDKKQVAVQLEFHVDKNGHITSIVPQRGDEFYKPEAKRTLEKTAAWLKKKGKTIAPAKMKDGSEVELIFKTQVGLANPDF